MDKNKDAIQILISKFQKTEFLNLQESRILGHLIVNPSLNTVKAICNELGIPDSKVYPALKNLEEEDLIYRNSSQRPAKYVGPDPEKLSQYLEAALQKHHQEKSNLIQDIDKQVSSLWNPDEPTLGQIAYLFKGNNINSEIRRLFKHVKNKMFLLLAPSSLKFCEIISKEVHKAINNNKKVNLAFPAYKEFSEVFEELKNLNSNYLKIRESVYTTNTYIVRDEDTMLNITHRDRGDVALLTNDPLLVDYVAGCFDNLSCCGTENPYDSKKLLNIPLDVIN